ncbi:MAG TPA: hypothetical protein VHP14_20790, partial [Anaerolineales bacterium]|nr:hypothetical protein [Anaerolineales bacterium]
MTQSSFPAGEKPGSREPLSLNFSIVARVRGEFSLGQLQQALDRVRVRHRLLIPGAEEENLVSAHFPLQSLTNGDSDHAWKEIVADELRTPFLNDSGPFARFIWLQSNGYSDLIATFHHGICDGFSGVYVMRDVLQALGNPNTRVPALPLPPHLVKFIPEAVTKSLRVKWQLRRNVMMIRLSALLLRLQKRFVARSRENESALEGLPPYLRTCILTQTLTASQTARLVECCKAEGITVHAAVCTAWLSAFADTLDEKASRARIASSPVSLRNRLTQPAGEMAGMFMSTVETRLDCKPGRGFWEMAREFHANLRQEATDEKVFMMPLMFSTRPPDAIMEVGKAFFSRPVKYDFSITNLGRLDLPAKIGSLQVESFYNLVNSSHHERTV